MTSAVHEEILDGVGRDGERVRDHEDLVYRSLCFGMICHLQICGVRKKKKIVEYTWSKKCAHHHGEGNQALHRANFQIIEYYMHLKRVIG